MNHFLLKILQSEGRSRASSEGEMESRKSGAQYCHDLVRSTDGTHQKFIWIKIKQ